MSDITHCYTMISLSSGLTNTPVYLYNEIGQYIVVI